MTIQKQIKKYTLHNTLENKDSMYKRFLKRRYIFGRLKHNGLRLNKIISDVNQGGWIIKLPTICLKRISLDDNCKFSVFVAELL